MNKKTITISFIFGLLILLGMSHINGFKINKNSNITEENEKIDTSSWKTYKNPDFNYTIKYPSDWRIDTAGAEYYSKILKDPVTGKTSKKYPEEVMGSTITLKDPEGDVLIFSYGYAELGIPLHVFKSKIVSVAGEKVYKTYVDGCDLFVPAGYVRSGYDCRNKQTKFYAVIYSDTIGKELFNPVQYKWDSGNMATYLSIATIHGNGATIWFNLKTPIELNDPSFGKTDKVLDAVISSIAFK